MIFKEDRIVMLWLAMKELAYGLKYDLVRWLPRRVCEVFADADPAIDVAVSVLGSSD
jgi:hypothetical protein